MDHTQASEPCRFEQISVSVQWRTHTWNFQQTDQEIPNVKHECQSGDFQESHAYSTNFYVVLV